MCQFNFAIVNSDSDQVKLKEIFERNGLGYSLFRNQNLEESLGSSLIVIMTTKTSCDCGSVIGVNTSDNSYKRDIEKEIKKLHRKKWSESKIQRYLDDKEKDEIRKQSSKAEMKAQELDKWIRTIEECFESSITKEFGILTHYFSGRLEDERFNKIENVELNYNKFEPEILRKLEFDKHLLLNVI